MSRLQKIRQEFRPQLPNLFHNLSSIALQEGERTTCRGEEEAIRALFPQSFGRPVVEVMEGEPTESAPLNVGVVLSGGQAAGGHNVIVGLFDALKTLHPESRLIGFLNGPIGIVENDSVDLTQEKVAPYRNQGGFDMLGSGRTKIETTEQFAACLETAKAHDLDGLIVIGGDDSNTNAALLAEFFIEEKCKTAVIGVPKTIDGDLRSDEIAISFGFDSATKTYSEMIGNLARDALSAKKYFHFIKLMGRSASHIALECALATHANFTLIGEEVAEKNLTLQDITMQLADLVETRAMAGKHYGVVLIPEGLVEFIPEMKRLIKELNDLSAEGDADLSELSREASSCFHSLPEEIGEQLLLDRDPHGNVQVSMIETEKLFIALVKQELHKRQFSGKFSPVNHFYGYEGRSGFPSNFDTHYCTALGYTAALLVRESKTGYITCVQHIDRPVQEWRASGLPLTMLMTLERRKGKEKPVIEKALVDLKGKAFQFFVEHREGLMIEDHYRFPGPIQFFGDADTIDGIPMTVRLELQG